MQYYNFRRLIDKYSREFTLICEKKGCYDDLGDYVKGEITKTVLTGAIIGFSESKTLRSDGAISTQDKTLHLLEPIDNALMGAKVIFDNDEYRIETQKGKGNADFTGVYSYTLKYVSAFNGGGKGD